MIDITITLIVILAYFVVILEHLVKLIALLGITL